jgi:hypothetical protein
MSLASSAGDSRPERRSKAAPAEPKSGRCDPGASGRRMIVLRPRDPGIAPRASVARRFGPLRPCWRGPSVVARNRSIAAAKLSRSAASVAPPRTRTASALISARRSSASSRPRVWRSTGCRGWSRIAAWRDLTRRANRRRPIGIQDPRNDVLPLPRSASGVPLVRDSDDPHAKTPVTKSTRKNTRPWQTTKSSPTSRSQRWVARLLSPRRIASATSVGITISAACNGTLNMSGTATNTIGAANPMANEAAKSGQRPLRTHHTPYPASTKAEAGIP